MAPTGEEADFADEDPSPEALVVGLDVDTVLEVEFDVEFDEEEVPVSGFVVLNRI